MVYSTTDVLRFLAPLQFWYCPGDVPGHLVTVSLEQGLCTLGGATLCIRQSCIAQWRLAYMRPSPEESVKVGPAGAAGRAVSVWDGELELDTSDLGEQGVPVRKARCSRCVLRRAWCIHKRSGMGIEPEYLGSLRVCWHLGALQMTVLESGGQHAQESLGTRWSKGKCLGMA